MKEARDKELASESQELDREVIIRLNSLKSMEADLAKRDPCGHLSTVQALIKAYRSGELKRSSDGTVTYWCDGKQIGGPKKFDVDDYLMIYRQRGSPESFWVEGVGQTEFNA